MKILLIDPPFYRIIRFYNRYFPLGLVSIGTVLQRKGHIVQVYDADFNENPKHMDYDRLPDHYQQYLACLKQPSHTIWQEVRKTVEDFEPDLVGISLWTTFAASGFYVAKLCKEVLPNCVVVAGGAHATIQPGETLEVCPSIDFVVRGEGEDSIVELVQGLEQRTLDPTQIRGLSFRKEASIVHNPDREFSRDLDAFPVPDRKLLMHESSYTSEDMGLLMTSRGCPFQCAYCATQIWRQQVRYRSPEHVLEEIRQTQARYRARQFTFKDDIFTMSRKRLVTFCEQLIQERIQIHWDCNARIDLIRLDLLKLMKKAGCNSIKLGIESGSERVLSLMNKKTHLAQIENACHVLRKAGIYWTGYFLIGIPGETREDMLATLSFMKTVKPDFASLGVYEPFPGTCLFQIGVEQGLIRENMTLEDFSSLPPNRYYVKDMRRTIDTMAEEEFGEIQERLKQEFHAYNRSLRRTLKRAWSRLGLYFTNPGVLFGDIRKYLSWL